MIVSSTGSTSSTVSNHWLVRLTSVSEQSQTLSPTSKTSSCSSAPEPQTPTSSVFYEQPKGDAGKSFLRKHPCDRWFQSWYPGHFAYWVYIYNIIEIQIWNYGLLFSDFR